MNTILIVVLLVACASALNFSDVKHMRNEIDTENDPQVKDKPLGMEPQPGNAGKTNLFLTGRIINGASAIPGQFPWQAVISMDDVSMCGGSIISSEWILTAAHCTLAFKNFVVYLGKTILNTTQTGELVRATSTKIVNDKYNITNFNNDIALLQISTIEFSFTIRPVQLPKKSDVWNTFAGQGAMISGFGRTLGSESVSDTLQYAHVNVITNTECRRSFGSKYVADTNICTRGISDKGTCNGDSGGPLVYSEGSKKTQIGIVSFGAVGCVRAPSAYTRVASYLDWITQNTGIIMRN